MSHAPEAAVVYHAYDSASRFAVHPPVLILVLMREMTEARSFWLPLPWGLLVTPMQVLVSRPGQPAMAFVAAAFQAVALVDHLQRTAAVAAAALRRDLRR